MTAYRNVFSMTRLRFRERHWCEARRGEERGRMRFETYLHQLSPKRRLFSCDERRERARPEWIINGQYSQVRPAAEMKHNYGPGLDLTTRLVDAASRRSSSTAFRIDMVGWFREYDSLNTEYRGDFPERRKGRCCNETSDFKTRVVGLGYKSAFAE